MCGLLNNSLIKEIMKIIDPASIKKIKDARETITELQSRLVQCETYLDDLARCAEICIVTNQFHLMGSFVDTANDYLKDRLDLIEFSERGPGFDKEKITIVEG
jgi:hypothetical protein